MHSVGCRHVQAYRICALLKYGLGDHKRETWYCLTPLQQMQTLHTVTCRHVQAYRIYALLKYGLGDHKGAAQTAEQGLAISPHCIELFYIFASAMHATGEYKVAVKSYDDALGLESKGEEHILQFLSFYQVGAVLLVCQRSPGPAVYQDWVQPCGCAQDSTGTPLRW